MEIERPPLSTEDKTLAQAERIDVTRETATDLADLMQHEEEVSILCLELEKEITEGDPGQLRDSVETALVELGIEKIESGTAKDLLPMIKMLVEQRLETSAEQSKEESKLDIHVRLQNLREEGVGLQATLKTIRAEFAGGIDKETEAVIGQFEALFSPEILPDKEERAAVESLFLSQGVSDFTPESFATFVYTIYEQPDETISEETKQRIERKFQLPRQRILTGGQLAKATFAKSEDGEYLHDSPENALTMENGMTSYVNSKGEAVISMAQPNQEPEIIFVRSMRNWLSEDGAKGVNYGTIRRTIDSEWGEMTGLFGDAQEEYDWQSPKRIESTERANRFLRLLIGSREPNHLLQLEDMTEFRKALHCLVNPLNQNEDDDLNDLRDLGILRGEVFDWNRLKTVGIVLRQNRFFHSQSLKDRTAPFRLLKEKLQALDQDAKTQSA